MISIRRATVEDTFLLADLSRSTFLESHGHSAPKETIDEYVSRQFSNESVRNELSDTSNIFHLIFYDEIAAGYSKVIFDSLHLQVGLKRPTKFERLYVPATFHGKGIAAHLFDFNLKISREHKQDGIWLYTWKENARAINFYKKHNFDIVGTYDFRLSETHANPNHLMVLRF